MFLCFFKIPYLSKENNIDFWFSPICSKIAFVQREIICFTYKIVCDVKISWLAHSARISEACTLDQEFTMFFLASYHVKIGYFEKMHRPTYISLRKVS